MTEHNNSRFQTDMSVYLCEIEYNPELQQPVAILENVRPTSSNGALNAT